MPADNDNSNNKAMLIVVMGVSGTGKTTLASEIAKHFNIQFLDADSLHSESAIKQMSQSIALTDDQREPWVQRICDHLTGLNSQGKSCVLAYSGLKQKHRNAIFSTYGKTIGILLDADKNLLFQRLKERQNHFMPPELLTSQIESMEPFDEKLALCKLNPADTVHDLLSQAADFISNQKIN